MVSFWVYDVAFLILFTVGVYWFLNGRKDELAREGWMFMWRTQYGVDAMTWTAKKFGWFLKKIRWVIVGTGAVLMGAMMWMLGQTVGIYLLYPEITKLIKAPPIAPLIPYFPKLFGMESLFPPFYFTYFIVALAIVAIVHEFSHGIFMKLSRIKIKSTGLVFLGPILGAFVEESKRSMNGKNKLDQMSVLGAGVFANLVTALLFYGLYVLFFFSSFTASGYVFDSYAAGNVMIGNVDFIGEDLGEMSVLLGGQSARLNMSEVEINGTAYLMSTEVKNTFAEGIDIEGAVTTVFLKTPAILSGINGAIVSANGEAIRGQEDLRWFLENKRPGDVVRLTTETEEGREDYDVMLSEHPEIEGRAYLGVGHGDSSSGSFIQRSLAKLMGFKESSTYYTPTWDGDFVYFIYYLLWWVMVINLLVALFNMMPLGILDGGRFFYLGIWGIFGSEKWARRAYAWMTYLIAFMFAAMMILWFIGIF